MEQRKFTEKEWEEIELKTKANYKYTQLTDKFVRSVFGTSNDGFTIDTQFVNSGKKFISPTKEYKAFLRYGNDYFILENDFEITTVDGFIAPKLTKRWREGMIKSALPLKDREHGRDVDHYLQELRKYEEDKTAHSMEHLGTIANVRHQIEDKHL